MSSITISSASAEEEIVSAYSRWSSLSGVVSISDAIPMTPFIGVRISWLMLARKADFSLLASIAPSRALSRSAWVASSVRTESSSAVRATRSAPRNCSRCRDESARSAMWASNWCSSCPKTRVKVVDRTATRQRGVTRAMVAPSRGQVVDSVTLATAGRAATAASWSADIPLLPSTTPSTSWMTAPSPPNRCLSWGTRISATATGVVAPSRSICAVARAV